MGAVRVESWGRLGSVEHEVRSLAGREALLPAFEASGFGLPYGNGRSYGDVCLNPGGGLWLAAGLDRFISFDDITGIITCEAGVLLRDIQRVMIPRGWMLPVTPGTQLVTVGGAIANDVHGKNHHRVGSFGDHVVEICLLRTDQQRIICGPNQKPDWFAATVGGLGLTGVILEASLQLRRVAGPWLDAEKITYRNLDEFFELSDNSEHGWEHTVSWVDCISGGGGRGIFMRGNHIECENKVEPQGKRLTVPLVPPFSLINRFSLRPFNTAYYYSQSAKSARSVAHYEKFFYPLDNILNWNRIYGPHGFYQYQSVIPRAVGKDSVKAMLKAIANSGDGSFLAVLKTFGNRHPIGMLSFPQPGVTLALDFPNKGERTLKLFKSLDAIVSESGGRIYPAKDARMPRKLFESGFPRLGEFLNYRDPGISSALSRRLMGN